MKTPTLEEIKEYFKNAKEVKNKYDDTIFELGEIIEGHCENTYMDKNSSNTVWSKSRGYAEIISYKEPNDKHVQSVINKFAHRSEVGFAKYGTTLERKDLNLTEWLNHLQEELMDATLYIEKLKDETNTTTKN